MIASTAALPLLAAPAPPGPHARLFESVGAGSPVAEQNLTKFLPGFYSTANARPLETMSRPVRRTLAQLLSTLAGRGNGQFVAQSSNERSTTLACPQGGSVVATDDNPSTMKSQLTAIFRNCAIDGQRLQGAVNWLRPYGRSERMVFGKVGETGNLPTFAYTDANGMITRYDGSRNFFEAEDRSWIYIVWNGDWSITSGAKRLSVTGMVLNTRNEAGTFSYTTEFEMAGDLTNGRTLAVINNAPLSGALGSSFTQGNMQFLVLNDKRQPVSHTSFGPAADGSDRFDIDTEFYGTRPATAYTRRVSQKLGGGLTKFGNR